MYWAVVLTTVLFGLLAPCGGALVFRGIFGKSVRPRVRNGESAGPSRKWSLIWLGLAAVVAGCLLVGFTVRKAVIVQPDLAIDGIAVGIAVGIGLVGFLWLIRSIAGDRSKGLRRCPRCWYSMVGVGGRRCPECGREAKSERAMLRARRSKIAILLAAMLSLVAPAGIFGRAYLAENTAKDAIPSWVLLHALVLPEGPWREAAHTTLYERFLNGGVPQQTVVKYQEWLIRRILASEENCWDRPTWLLLIACRMHSSEPLPFADIEALEMQRARQAWARMGDPDPGVRAQNAMVTRTARSALTMFNNGADSDPAWREEREAISDRVDLLLAGRAPTERLAAIAENLASGNERLVTGTMDLMAGSSAGLYADDLFALFDEPSERRPVGSGMNAARLLRIPMMENPDLFERFAPLLDSQDPVDVTFVARMLATPLHRHPEPEYWTFPGWREWLFTQLRKGPAGAARDVQSALHRSGEDLDEMLAVALARIRAEPQNIPVLLPNPDSFDERGQLAFFDTFEWLADSVDPDVRFNLAWKLAMMRREGPAQRKRAEALLTRMGIEYPPGDPMLSNFDYIYNDPLGRKVKDP